MRTSYPTTERCTRPPETIDPPATIESSATPLRCGSANTNLAGGYCCCQLWSGQRTSFAGRYFQTNSLQLYDLPSTPPPIFVAASGPKSARLAGQYGDGWITQSRELINQKLLAAFDAGARAAGRDPAALGKRVELFAVVGDNEEASRAAALWRFTAGAADQPNPVEIQRAADSNPIDKVLANWTVGIDAEPHIIAVQWVLDGGAVPFLHFPQADPITAINFYRDYVMPKLH